MIFLFVIDSENSREIMEYIYLNYKKLMLNKAYYVLKDYSSAEDAVSEAFLRIYKNIDKLGDLTSGKTIAYIIMIVKNTAITMYNKRNNHPDSEIDENESDDYNLEYDVISRVGVESIYKTLNNFDEENRNIFLYKYSYNMSHKEIADLLGTTENNITVKLHRFKRKLASILEREGAV